jgi:hypothetical protein
LHRPREQIRSDHIYALCRRDVEWMRRHVNAHVSDLSLPSAGKELWLQILKDIESCAVISRRRLLGLSLEALPA